MKFSFCTDALFQGVSMEEAIGAVKAAGFDTVERWIVPEAEVEGMQAALARHGVKLSAICTDFFDLTDPAKRPQYLDGVKTALKKAKALSCPALITQVGPDTGAPREEQHQAIVDGLKAAAPLLEEAGITLLVEPLNTVKDHPGYYLTSSKEGLDIIREVDSPCVKLLFDAYHQLHMGEDIIPALEGNLHLIGHFHVAGLPNRDEKIFAVFNFRRFFDFMKESKAEQPIGIELFPTGSEALQHLMAELQAILQQ